MKKAIISIAFSFLLILGCDYSLKENQPYSKMEIMVAKEWSFRSLLINGHFVTHLGHAFEPSSQRWENRWIRWLWFDYGGDKTYEYRSDNRRTPLGHGDNYQPEIGYWALDESDSLMIHNVGTSYETTYKIIHISDTLFIREYERTILATNDTTKWKVGDLAVYREVLEIRNGPFHNDD